MSNLQNQNCAFQKLTTPDSLKLVRDIADDIWPKTFAEILTSEQIRYMMAMMYSQDVLEKELAEGFSFAVLSIDCKPAGYVSWFPYPAPGSKEAKLHKIYLLEEFHGQGFGQLMLKYVMGECRQAGFQTLRLNVNKHNTRAQRAYIRAGFTNTESVVIDIGHGFVMDDYIMKIDLENQPH